MDIPIIELSFYTGLAGWFVIAAGSTARPYHSCRMAGSCREVFEVGDREDASLVNWHFRVKRY
ncbi:hypothetical protein [Cellvibrio sp. OA-2007]|uniref:hypothetical protein n=1 Tax=Cellvibrio sp. OA-2007 TaxID=529823 RepID=UPI0007830FD8|nr:hypothetical protein [Cellvibrio sp. OA-2007]